MDNFLASLYKEEQTKIAAADLGYFMNTLPVDELEEFLGLAKVGVAGPVEAILPDSENGELDKAQKRVDDYAAKIQGQEPPTRKESEETSSVSYQGPGKDAVKEAMIRRIQKIAASGCMTKTDEFTSPEAKKKAKALSSTLKMGKGQPLEVRKKAVSIASKMKVSQGVGDMGSAGGIGTGMGTGGMGMGGAGGMETTAAMKAKIAMRAWKIAKKAPAHIKVASSHLAGKELAKLSGSRLDEVRRLNRETIDKDIEDQKIKGLTSPVRRGLTYGMGGAVGGAIPGLVLGRGKLMAAGAALGGASGAITGVRQAKALRELLDKKGV